MGKFQRNHCLLAKKPKAKERRKSHRLSPKKTKKVNHSRSYFRDVPERWPTIPVILDQTCCSAQNNYLAQDVRETGDSCHILPVYGTIICSPTSWPCARHERLTRVHDKQRSTTLKTLAKDDHPFDMIWFPRSFSSLFSEHHFKPERNSRVKPQTTSIDRCTSDQLGNAMRPHSANLTTGPKNC